MMEAAALGPIAAAAQEAAKNMQQGKIVNELIRGVKAINASHPNATVSLRAGLGAELWHVATYNIAAIERDILFRCGQVKDQHSAADLYIHLPNHPYFRILAHAQVKMRNKVNTIRAIRNPRYNGMQKVVAQGQQDAGKGLDSRLRYGGASSSPLSREAAHELVQDPEGQLASMRPDILTDAVRSGLVGAAVGGLDSASVAAAATALITGTISDEDLRHIAEAGVIGALSSGTGSAATVLASDPIAGGVVSGMVFTLYSILKCDSQSCAVTEGAQGAAGTIAVLANGPGVPCSGSSYRAIISGVVPSSSAAQASVHAGW